MTASKTWHFRRQESSI